MRRRAAMVEQIDPEHSNDRGALYFHWWPKKGSTEWVQYDHEWKVR